MADYTLLQAQQDVASLRGQIAHLLANAEFINVIIDGIITGNIQAFQPGSSPAIPETWHQVTVDSGTWSGGNGVWYRATSWGTVQVFGSTITGTSMAANSTKNVNLSNPLPTGYRPLKTWNMGGAGIPGRMGAEITSAGVIVAINGTGSAVTAATEVDIAGEYPLNL